MVHVPALTFCPDSQVKQASITFGAYPGSDEAAQEETTVGSTDAAAAQPQDTIPSSDPTIAHAGLTELGLNKPAEEQAAQTEGEPEGIAEASTGDNAANQSAGTQWDNATAANGGTSEQMDESFEMVPRPAAETEPIHEPAQPQSTNSWADQSSANAVATEAAADNNTTNGIAATDAEGYQSVERRGRGGHRGEGRGRGGRGRGGPRGGHRGNFRGRGEGRGRGGRGGAPQPQA